MPDREALDFLRRGRRRPDWAAATVDFLFRHAICPRLGREFPCPTTWSDLAAIASFLPPIVGEGAGSLRILRLLRTYPLLDRLRADFPFFHRTEEVIIVAVNLAVFVFVMTGIVFFHA